MAKRPYQEIKSGNRKKAVSTDPATAAAQGKRVKKGHFKLFI